MKNLLFLLVALTPTPSSAREAILDVFSPEAKPDFAVLASQLRGEVDLEQSVEPPPAPVDAFSPELNGDFELVPHSFTINPYAARPAVPSWMRAVRHSWALLLHPFALCRMTHSASPAASSRDMVSAGMPRLAGQPIST